eukprot:jgi/Ulvmu1/6084/UM027_0062.1
MPQLTLQYLPMHGRAEAIRMFLHYCGLDFKDDVLEYDVFARKKDAKMLPFDQVPVLYVDGLPIAQTGSILRYLSRISSNAIEDPVRAALADSAFEAAQEMPMAQVYVAVNLMEETELRESAKAFLECLPEYLVNWSKILGDQKYFHGDAPGYADFFIWSLLDIGRQLVPLPELMKGHATLRAWSTAVKKLPAVATVLSNRPKIRDLSKFKL